MAEYLIQQHGFTRLYLTVSPVTPLIENTEDDRGLRLSSPKQVHDDQHHTFDDVDSLLDFTTRSWRDDFVTTDIWDDAALDLLVRRPFFLLVSVDAPVSLRWNRFKDR